MSYTETPILLENPSDNTYRHVEVVRMACGAGYCETSLLTPLPNNAGRIPLNHIYFICPVCKERHNRERIFGMGSERPRVELQELDK